MPTALQLGPENWRQYLTQGRRRHRTGDQPDRRQREALLRQVRCAAERIKSELGAKRVLLIGSLAHGFWWDEDSDVDLVVEGLNGADYWEAWAIAEECIPGRPVEVIDPESKSLGRDIPRKETEMTCHRCGSQKMTEQVTDLPFKLDVHQVLIVKDVPCRICDSCGEILLADNVMTQIDKMIAKVRETESELEVVRFAA